MINVNEYNGLSDNEVIEKAIENKSKDETELKTFMGHF